VSIGQFTLDLNLILQLLAMKQNGNSNAVKAFKSFVASPLLMLSSPGFNQDDCKRIVLLQISYLLQRSLIERDCSLKSGGAGLIIPMRNEKMLINLIQNIIQEKYFDR
jgi:hypothetical protein